MSDPSLINQVEQQLFFFAHNLDSLQSNLRTELATSVNDLQELLSFYLPTLNTVGSAAPLAPPPPPPPTILGSLQTHSSSLIHRNRYLLTGTALTVTALSATYVGLGPRRRRAVWDQVMDGWNGAGKVWTDVKEIREASERPLVKKGDRREVVLLLGADSTELGYPLATYLESKGFIVVASVSSKEACVALENLGHGYIRALFLKPEDPDSAGQFLACLKGVLSMRFPINIAGDPYPSNPNQLPLLTTIISLLSLPLPHQSHLNSPAYNQATLNTPMAIINALLPTLLAPLPISVVPNSLREASKVAEKERFLQDLLEKKIIALLPAMGEIGHTPSGDIRGNNLPLKQALESMASSLPDRANAGSSSATVSVHILQTGLISPISTLRSEGRWYELANVRLVAARFGDWVVSWVWGGRRESGFEVLENAVGKVILGKDRAWWVKQGPRVWRVGAGSYTYTLLPLVLPTRLLQSLLSLSHLSTSPHHLTHPLSRPPTEQSAAARKAGEAALKRSSPDVAESERVKSKGPEVGGTEVKSRARSTGSASGSGSGNEGSADEEGEASSVEGLDGSWVREV
ncbi:hypothetical protein [Phaffia rhodozyma]|uniref:DUF1776-domain-containing protein n=1 Tax=Phaffia rhodozyma TaxID=264483 RepID=A0A0F7SX42_PHARH|nr:hypothetical protein [Phaffia rhodozyma]